jgi:hypothetical protein
MAPSRGPISIGGRATVAAGASPLASFPEWVLQDARAAASGYRAAVAEGADPALVKSVAKKVETVDQMLDRFLTDHSAPGPRWKAEMRRVLAHDVRPAIGAYKINKVCKADIIALLNTIRDRGAGVQANRALQVVRKAFNWAASEDYLTDSPASGIAETRQGGTPVPSSVKSGDSGILAGPPIVLSRSPVALPPPSEAALAT